MRVAQFTVSFFLLASRIAHADWQINLTPGVTPLSHDIYQLHMTILGLCVLIAALVFGVMVYILIHHRQAKGAIPATFHEHLPLELTWTLIPLLLLIVMAIPATRVLIHLNDPSQPNLTVKITGHQWKWEYDYLEKGIHFFSNMNTPYAQIHNQTPKDNLYLRSVDHPLVLPIHQKIRLLFTSNDVIHMWFVPELGVQRDAVPGFINESWTRINRPGIYYGQCNKLCGINHAYMPIVIIALAKKDFDEWLRLQKNPSSSTLTTFPSGRRLLEPNTQATNKSVTPSKTQITIQTLSNVLQRGEQLYLNTCAVCHQPNGTGLPPVYPALKGSKIATGPLPNHLDRVLNGKPGTAMQAFKDQFNDEDLAALITYERNAWGNNTGTHVTAAEVKAARGKPPAGN